MGHPCWSKDLIIGFGSAWPSSGGTSAAQCCIIKIVGKIEDAASVFSLLNLMTIVPSFSW